MDCSRAEDLFGSYVLGDLPPRDQRFMESHLETCDSCTSRLREDGETDTRLAFAVPQLEVPPSVKQQLFLRVDAGVRPPRPAPRRGVLARLLEAGIRPFRAHSVKAAASLLTVALVVGGFWLNGRVNEISDANKEMSGKIETVVEREAEVRRMIDEQRYLTSMTAAPGVSVNMLHGTERTTRAWGMIACCAVSDSGTVALLAVLNLPPLPADQVYQVWLMQGGRKYDAGLFTVDSTGYAQAAIIPVVPFAEIDGIGITIEPAGGSDGPTGTNVLKGDL